MKKHANIIENIKPAPPPQGEKLHFCPAGVFVASVSILGHRWVEVEKQSFMVKGLELPARKEKNAL